MMMKMNTRVLLLALTVAMAQASAFAPSAKANALTSPQTLTQQGAFQSAQQ